MHSPGNAGKADGAPPPNPIGPIDPLVDDPDEPGLPSAAPAGHADHVDPSDSLNDLQDRDDGGEADELDRFTQLFRILERLTEIGSEDPESEVSLAEIASEVARYTSSTQTVLSLVDPATGDLDVKATHGFGEELPRELSFIEDGIHGWVLKIGTPMIIEHADQNGGLPLLGFEKTKLIAAPLQVGSQRVGALSVMGPTREGGYREEDMLFLSTIGSILGGQIGNGRSEAKGKEAVRKAIEALTLALDARDAYTRGHSQRVAIYSLAIANELERDGRQTFGKKRRNSLLMSALLHDVGKIGIRDEILLKPGKLTEEEFALIKTHPAKGAEIVRAIPGFDGDVIEGILHHHERWDGKGYPGQQSGERIHLFGRIIGLADAFDAIVTSRPYSSGESYDFAIGRIEELGGVTFDPEVVRAMLRAFKDRSILSDLGQISHARLESETVQAEVKGVDQADRTLRRIFGRNVTDLPTLPHVVSQILEKTRNSDASIEEVANLIATDQALVSTYLRLVNSAFYGFSRRITTLKQAITLLGFRSVRNVVVNAGVAGIFRRRSFNNHYRHRLWDHSVTTAVAARVLAPVVGFKAKEEAFTAGLLHDIGKVVIDQYAPKPSVAIQRRVELGEEARVVEQEVLGADHTQVGAWVSERWHLPKSLCWVIQYHHDWQNPDIPGGTDLVRLVAAANAIATIRRNDDREALTRASEEFAASPGNIYDFDVAKTASLLVEIWTGKNEAMKMFGSGPHRPQEPVETKDADDRRAAVATPGDVAAAARRARGWQE